MEKTPKLDASDRALLLRVALILAALTTVVVGTVHWARGNVPYFRAVGIGEPAFPLWRLVVLEIPVWFGTVALVPALLRLADAFPLWGPRRWAHAGAHLVAFPLAVVANAAIITLGRWPLLGVEPGGFLLHVAVYCVLLVSFYPLSYSLVVLGHHALAHARHLRQRELDEARLGGLLAKARLDALASQMQPHFLFNSLNSVAALIGDDDERAHRLVVDLGTLLRAYCDAADDEVPLAEELALLDAYVAVQQARFGERLRYVRRVPEEALPLLVPRFTLQPLVENAVKHAVERRPAPVEVEVTARCEGSELVLVVTDDGPGIAAGAGERVGLGNLRERLRVLHGDAPSLRLARRGEGGTEVTLRLPAVPAALPVQLAAASA